MVGVQARVNGRREDREDARCHMSRGVGAFFGEEPLNFLMEGKILHPQKDGWPGYFLCGFPMIVIVAAC